MIVIRIDNGAELTTLPNLARTQFEWGSRLVELAHLEQEIEQEIQKDLEALDRLYPEMYTEYWYAIKGIDKTTKVSASGKALFRYAKVITR